MNGDDFYKEFNEWWTATSMKANSEKDSHGALMRLIDLYEGLPANEKTLMDRLFSEWILSNEENRRFDAMAMMDQFEIHGCIPALKIYRDKLYEDTKNPEAPYEFSKINRILDCLE